MIFRKLLPSEHILTRALYEECFPDDAQEFVDYYYRYRASKNRIWAAIEEESGKVVSMLHANPVQIICVSSADSEKRMITIPYLVAIGTAKNRRRQGLMRRLMEMVLAEFHEERIPFVFLMPASECYYTPFGFQRAFAWQWEEDAVCTAKELGMIRQILDGERNRFVSLPASELSDGQLEALSQQVNQRLSERFGMYVRRSVSYYRDLQEQQKASEGELIAVFGEDGAPICTVCTGKEEFPPMMALITDRERFEAITGKSVYTDEMERSDDTECSDDTERSNQKENSDMTTRSRDREHPMQLFADVMISEVV